MGSLISFLRRHIEQYAGDNPWALQVGGILITFVVVFSSGFSGWLIERIAFHYVLIPNILKSLIIVIAMASTIATRSLIESVLEVITALPHNQDESQLQCAREKLSHIVGRDVWLLKRPEILRATAETASENAVDGVFAPICWMLIGATLWSFSTNLPGPLALGWAFKASSTIDSMIGYKYGKMRWLGKAGARLDDILTWLPSRLVLLTLPLVSKSILKLPYLVKLAWIDGSKDISPNAGISEAIFAYCADVSMGGNNKYKGHIIIKPKLAQNYPEANIQSIKRVLKLTLRLEILWLILFSIALPILSTSKF